MQWQNGLTYKLGLQSHHCIMKLLIAVCEHEVAKQQHLQQYFYRTRLMERWMNVEKPMKLDKCKSHGGWAVGEIVGLVCWFADTLWNSLSMIFQPQSNVLPSIFFLIILKYTLSIYKILSGCGYLYVQFSVRWLDNTIRNQLKLINISFFFKCKLLYIK